MKRSIAISVCAMVPPVTETSREDERKHDIGSCNEAEAALHPSRDAAAVAPTESTSVMPPRLRSRATLPDEVVTLKSRPRPRGLGVRRRRRRVLAARLEADAGHAAVRFGYRATGMLARHRDDDRQFQAAMPLPAGAAHALGTEERASMAPQQRNDDKGIKVARQIVFTPKAAKPPATYSQAVKAAGLVFVSGTAPTDPATGVVEGTTIQEQTRQCLENIRAILEEAGSSLDKIVSVTVVLADEDDFSGMNEEWLKWFPSNPPARQGAKLPARIPGVKISIAAIAEA